MPPDPDDNRLKGAAAIEECERFFMKEGRVHKALRAITAKLDALGIPHAVVGGIALAAHGYVRATDDVDLLVTSDGLAAIHAALEGLGYVPPFAGSKQLRDVANNTRIEFLVTGQYPGDGKPKPVAFPDPQLSSIDIGGVRYLNLPTLVDLKLASGMTNPGRLKDLADVQELVRILRLPSDFATKLNPFVRDKFAELWSGVQSDMTQPD